MSLKAEPPLRMCTTVLECPSRVVVEIGTIHRLEREDREPEVSDGFRREALLWVYQLQLVTASHTQIGSLLGADAQPVYSSWWYDRAVGFDRHLEATTMQLIDQTFVELQQRLTTGADDERNSVSPVSRPMGVDRPTKFARGVERTTPRSIHPYKVGIAERTNGGGPILFPAGPQVTSGKTEEDCRPSGLCTLTLQRIVYFLYGISHLVQRVRKRAARPNPRPSGESGKIPTTRIGRSTSAF